MGRGRDVKAAWAARRHGAGASGRRMGKGGAARHRGEQGRPAARAREKEKERGERGKRKGEGNGINDLFSAARVRAIENNVYFRWSEDNHRK